jgi:hypothetical protein
MSGSPLDPMMHMLTTLAFALGAAALVTVSTVMFLRWLGLHWSGTLPGVLLGPLLWPFDQGAAGFAVATSVFATATGARWHADDLRHGSDRAQEARDRRTPLDAGRARIERRGVRGGRWIDRRGLAVGRDERGRTVRIPVGHTSGRHALVVGATGSGKTVTQAWIAGCLVRAGYGAVVIDPPRATTCSRTSSSTRAQRTAHLAGVDAGGTRGLQPVRARHRHRARRQGPRRRDVTEPHYLRQAQRYLGHAVRALKANGPPRDRHDAVGSDGPRQARMARARPPRRARQAGPRLRRLAHRRATPRPRRHP